MPRYTTCGRIETKPSDPSEPGLRDNQGSASIRPHVHAMIVMLTLPIQIPRGIADQEIQLDILGDQHQSMILEDMLRFVEAKESGKQSASRLLDPTNISAASSTYRRAKQHDRGKQPDIRDKTPAECTYCGGNIHDRNAPLHVRRNECRAYDHLCAHGGKQNHFEDVCLSKSNSKPPRGRANVSACEQEVATLDQLCTVEATHRWNGPRSITLDHHLYNNFELHANTNP